MSAPAPPHNKRLSRRQVASLGGYARNAKADPDEIAATRARGGATRAAQLRGRSDWGKRMAEAKRLKRYGPPPTNDERFAALEARISQLEKNGGTPDE